MTINEFYLSIGGDYEDVLERIGDEKAIRGFVIRFLDDQSYFTTIQALCGRDFGTAFHAAHTLKGISQNLGFGRLGKSGAILAEILRNGIEPPEEMVRQFEMDYRCVTEAIKKLKSTE